MKRLSSSIFISAVLSAFVVFTFAFTLISCGSGGGVGGTATLRWNAPTLYENRAPLNPKSEIALYTIYYWTSTQNYSQTVPVMNSGETTITINYIFFQIPIILL